MKYLLGLAPIFNTAWAETPCYIYPDPDVASICELGNTDERMAKVGDRQFSSLNASIIMLRDRDERLLKIIDELKLRVEAIEKRQAK